MNISDLSQNSPVFRKLVAPLVHCIVGNAYARANQRLSDLEWLETGVIRVLGEDATGRGFLQKLFHMGKELSVGHFFASLRSSRRLSHLHESLQLLLSHMKDKRSDFDPLKDYDELSKFEIHAGDGHYHAHACHDAKIDGKYRSVQHFYTMNMRTLGMNHLAMAEIGGEAKKEHDLSAIRRQNLDSLRQGAPKGTKVLYVWDRAIIGFELWDRLKKQGGVYFITRSKSNLKFEVQKKLDFDRDDEVNKGILFDQIVKTRTDGFEVRRVIYRCPFNGQTYSFLTNLHHSIRPGLIAHLYRMRWDIEKVFDEIKNRLGEKKAWAANANGKIAQAHFICLAHNLLRLLEDELEQEGVVNQQDPLRRQIRLDLEIQRSKVSPEKVPSILKKVQRVVQRSTIFIRWIRAHLYSLDPWGVALRALARSYAVFSR